MGTRRLLSQDDFMKEAGRMPSHGKWSKERLEAGGHTTGMSALRGTWRAEELLVGKAQGRILVPRPGIEPVLPCTGSMES